MPVTAVPSVVLTRVKLVALTVAAFMASLKVALIRVLVATPSAPAAGTVRVTVGRVVSATTPVVKVQTWEPAPGSTAVLPASVLPATSVTAALTVAVNRLPAGSRAGVVGVKVAVREAAS